MKSDKTPWYPGSVNPVRVGYYEVSSGSIHYRNRYFLNGSRRFWDGTKWCGGWLNDTTSIMGTHAQHRWRGFTTNQNLTRK